MTKLRIALVCLLPLCAVALVPQPAQAQGRRKKGRKKPRKGKRSWLATIHRYRGTPITKVKIRDGREQFKRVRYTKPTGSVDGVNVREVVYHEPEAPRYHSGRSQIRAGQYKKAVKSFASARRDAGSGTWLWFYATYWLGEAHRLAGSFDDAITNFEKVKKKGTYKEGKHLLYPAAILGLGLAYSGKGDHDKAIETLGKITDEYGRRWGARAQLAIGDAALAANRLSAARKAYSLAKGAPSNDLKLAAKVGTGKTLIAKKQFDRAIKEFKEIMDEPGVDPEVAGDAWVGKGDCMKAQAEENNNDANMLKEALIAYQTCVVRFAGTINAYPKALYMAAKVLELLQKPKQAEYMKKELKARCPNSKWTSKLKD